MSGGGECYVECGSRWDEWWREVWLVECGSNLEGAPRHAM